MLSLGLALLVVAYALAAAGAVWVAHARAVTAADLAALAGAERLARALPGPCDAAAAVAVANGSVLRVCRVQSGTVEITVARGLVGPARPFGPVVARARAEAGRVRVPPPPDG